MNTVSCTSLAYSSTVFAYLEPEDIDNWKVAYSSGIFAYANSVDA